MLTDFQNSWTDRLISKFAMKSFLNIPPHLKGIATLPCEILRSQNSDSLKHVLWLVTNHKLEGSVAACLRCGGLFSYHLLLSLVVNGKRLVNFRQKVWLPCFVSQ